MGRKIEASFLIPISQERNYLITKLFDTVALNAASYIISCFMTCGIIPRLKLIEAYINFME